LKQRKDATNRRGLSNGFLTELAVEIRKANEKNHICHTEENDDSTSPPTNLLNELAVAIREARDTEANNET
jgi:hypothetical protein